MESLGTSLLYASENGDFRSVKKLLAQGVDTNHRNENGDTALICSCDRGHYDISKYLISKGANVNLSDKENNSPIYYASFEGHSKIVQLLINSGAEVNKICQAGAMLMLIVYLNNNSIIHCNKKFH